jgi:hypothetical protein
MKYSAHIYLLYRDAGSNVLILIENTDETDDVLNVRRCYFSTVIQRASRRWESEFQLLIFFKDAVDYFTHKCTLYSILSCGKLLALHWYYYML